MTEQSEQLPEDLSSFEDMDPYKVLGLDPDQAKTITAAQIKKAYKLRALKCHPDKAKTDSERAQFHTEFQTVALAYSVLGADSRRARYDASGSMEDAMRDTLDEEATTMREFFEELWKSEITVEMLEHDRQVYRGGGEERADVLKYYKEGKGRMSVVMENVLHTTEEDEERIRGMIEEAIEAGEVKMYAAFKKKETAQEKAQRAKAAAKEAKEAEELSRELGLDKLKKKSKKGESDEDSLRALIQSRGQKRMTSLLDNLEAKYGAKDDKKKRKKTAAAAASADPALENEPTEDEFLRIQAEMEEARRSNKKAAKIKGSKGNRSGRN